MERKQAMTCRKIHNNKEKASKKRGKFYYVYVMSGLHNPGGKAGLLEHSVENWITHCTNVISCRSDC